MAVDDSDDLAERDVWLPRGRIAGKLWCTGDRGKLFIRRWVARDLRLVRRDRETHLAG